MAVDIKVLEIYAAAWVERNAEKRMALLEMCWGPQALYTDPENQVQGREGLSDCIGQYHEAGSSDELEPTSSVDEHHGQLRVRWRLVGQDKQPKQEGMSFGFIGEDGLLQRMTGFFGPFPELGN